MEKIIGTQDVKLIPATHIKNYFENWINSSLDVFYSASHKVVVKIQRKKRKLNVAAIMTPDNEPIDIVWKDPPMDPSENLTRLLQFEGAYATETIDKATEVQILLREKEQNIQLLEQQLA